MNPLADMSQSIDITSESIYFMVNVTATAASQIKVSKNLLEKYSGSCLVNVDFRKRELVLHYQ